MTVLLDTGPLVALIKKDDNHHDWAKKQWGNHSPPFFTCESVITESFFLLRQTNEGQRGLIKLLLRGNVIITFELTAEIKKIDELLERYANIPMSLADACLVRMSELYPNTPILTLDSDFHIYRKHRNEMILVIMP